MSRHVVVIGAGPGGLAAAMLLARAGARVTLLERLGRVGGRTATLQTPAPGNAPGNTAGSAPSPPGHSQFRFDLGPTFFLYPAVLEEIFAACGYCLRDEVELIRLDPQYRLIFEQGGELLASPDVPRMQRELAKLNAHDAAQLPRFLEDNRAKFAAFKPILQQPWRSAADLLRFNPLKMLPLVRPWSSVEGDLKRYFHDERVRLAFSFQSKYLGMSPFQCPSLFTILSFLEYEHGVHHPVGGCGAVSEAMARVAAEMGVEIRLNQPVRRLLFEGRRAVGVATDRGELPADAVVVNADFAAAMQQMVPDRLRRRWTDARLAKKKYSCSTFMMYLGIEGVYDDLHHHTIFLSKDYRTNLREIERDHTLETAPSVYVQNACVTDPGQAPRGMSSLYVLAPITNQRSGIDWEHETPRVRAMVLRQLAKLGLSDLERRIRYEKIVTPACWERDLNVHVGATFNLAHSLGQMLHLRPQNRFEDLDGVYLVGGGTHPGSGLPVIYESARITSRLVAKDLGLQCRPDTHLPDRSGSARDRDRHAQLAEVE